MRKAYIAIFCVVFNSVPIISLTGLLFSNLIIVLIEVIYTPYKDKYIILKIVYLKYLYA